MAKAILSFFKRLSQRQPFFLVSGHFMKPENPETGNIYFIAWDLK